MKKNVIIIGALSSCALLYYLLQRQRKDKSDRTMKKENNKSNNECLEKQEKVLITDSKVEMSKIKENKCNLNTDNSHNSDVVSHKNELNYLISKNDIDKMKISEKASEEVIISEDERNIIGYVNCDDNSEILSETKLIVETKQSFSIQNEIPVNNQSQESLDALIKIESKEDEVCYKAEDANVSIKSCDISDVEKQCVSELKEDISEFHICIDKPLEKNITEITQNMPCKIKSMTEDNDHVPIPVVDAEVVNASENLNEISMPLLEKSIDVINNSSDENTEKEFFENSVPTESVNTIEECSTGTLSNNNCNEIASVDENSDANDKTVPQQETNLENGFWSIEDDSSTLQATISSDLASQPLENGISNSQSIDSRESANSSQENYEVKSSRNATMLADTPVDDTLFYQFEIHQELVGRLIGKKGHFINKVKSATNTTAIVTGNQNGEAPECKLCSIEGRRSQVMKALKMIRDHFPENQYPDVTLDQVNSQISQLPEPSTNPVGHVEIPTGIVVQVSGSCVSSAGEVWLQLPMNPTFRHFRRLQEIIRRNYGGDANAPVVPLPIPARTICVCCYNGEWLRCEVLDHDDEMCSVILLDHGGIVTLPVSSLRQIRGDFIAIPFQARQTILYGIEPLHRTYNEEGRLALESFVEDNANFATIAAYSADGVPLVNLYQRNSNKYTFINEKMVELGHAQWSSVTRVPQMSTRS